MEPREGVQTMPEHRARKHHQDRVAETLREEIAVIIDGELSDPRIGSATGPLQARTMRSGSSRTANFGFN